jgi:hypothetical protein
VGPALSADLGIPSQPPASPSQWQFSFTPYGWATSINGDATARGHTVDIDENFIQIIEKSDSIMALMGYFEARKGRVGLFTDVVWADLGFPGHANFDRSGNLSRQPFEKLPNVNVAVDANLNIKAHAQVDYQSTIIQSGAAYEVANWSGSALDVLGGARYWNQNVDLSLNVTGNLSADVTATATFDRRTLLKDVLRRRGLELRPRTARLLEHLIERRDPQDPERTLSRTQEIEVSKALAIASSGDMEWVDPFVGARIRHQLAPGKEVMLEGDVGGFGVGSDFSWQLVGTYGFDTSLFGTPFHAVIGYRALSVDFSENGRFGKNGIDFVQHGPIMGVTFRW